MGFADYMGAGDRAVRHVLGGPVTYTPGVGDPVTVEGVFDAQYHVASGGDRGEVSSIGPAVFLDLADLPGDPLSDEAARVTVASVTYSVHEAKPDGLGRVVLLLHRT